MAVAMAAIRASSQGKTCGREEVFFGYGFTSPNFGKPVVAFSGSGWWLSCHAMLAAMGWVALAANGPAGNKTGQGNVG